MNETNSTWADQSILSAVRPLHKLFAALACLIASLALPFSASEPFAFAVLAFLFVYVVATARSPLPVTLLLSTAFLAVIFAFGHFGPASFLLSLIVGIASCSFLMTVSRRPFLFLLLPLAAAVIAFFTVSDSKRALLPLAILPAAVLLSYSTVKGKTKTESVCYTAGGVLLSTLIVLGVMLWQTTGTLRPDAIVSIFDTWKDMLTSHLILWRDQYLELTMQFATPETQPIYDQFLETFSDHNISEMVTLLVNTNTLKNLSPSLLIVFCSIVAYEAKTFLNATYRTVGLQSVLTREACVLSISSTAAVLYAISFVLVLFIPSNTMFSAVVENLSLILMPGLFVVGVRGLAASLSKARGGMRVLLVLMIGSMLCCYAGGALYVLAMWGAYVTIAGAIQRKLIEKMIENGFSHKDDDDDDLDP